MSSVHLWVCKAPLGKAAWHWEARVTLLLTNITIFPHPSSWPVGRWELGVQNAHMLPSCLIREALGWHFPLWGKECQAALQRCHCWTNPCTFCLAGLGFKVLPGHIWVSHSLGDLLMRVLTLSTATAEPAEPWTGASLQQGNRLVPCHPISSGLRGIWTLSQIFLL